MRRLVIVGEMNPYGADPAFALYHLPRGASGDRLRSILGLADAEYEPIPKFNLCAGRWSTAAARARAAQILEGSDVVVALGARVADAFSRALGRERPPFFRVVASSSVALVSIPHPSGRCREWNDPGAPARALAAVRSAAPEFPRGIA